MATYPIVTFATTTFQKEDIRSASVTEEFSPLSITVPVSQLELELFSEDNTFSIINPSGDFALLQHRTPLSLVENVDGAGVFIGKYYLDTWENLTDNLIKLNCMDEIGLLGTLNYRGGLWETPITAGALLTEIFADLTVGYEVDPDLALVTLTGWIPICTYREALQQIMFAAGGYILAARQNGFIKFGRADASGAVTRGIRTGVPRTGQSRVYQKRWRVSQWSGVMPVYTIPDSEQAVTRKVNLRTQVTGVEISMHDISKSTARKQLFSGTLDAGTYEIQFSQPMWDLTITAGTTIYTSGANYAILTVAADATSVTLEGAVYNDSVTSYRVDMANPDGVKENIIQIPDGSMVNSSNGQAIAQRVYDYYQIRHVQEVKLIRPTSYIGAEVKIATLYNREIQGFIEKMTIDLAGGFHGQTTIVGDPVPVT
jgi:hypothetical protein